MKEFRFGFCNRSCAFTRQFHSLHEFASMLHFPAAYFSAMVITVSKTYRFYVQHREIRTRLPLTFATAPPRHPLKTNDCSRSYLHYEHSYGSSSAYYPARCSEHCSGYCSGCCSSHCSGYSRYYKTSSYLLIDTKFSVTGDSIRRYL